jgi:hypothetical protein
LFQGVASHRRARTRIVASARIALALALCCCAVPAAAGDTGTLTITGTITKSCALTGPGGTVDLGDVSVAGSKDIIVQVDCNTPFAYAVVSANHALTTSGQAIVGGTFDQSLPYALSTDFQTSGSNFGDSDIASASMTDAAAAPCLAGTFDPGCPYTTSGTTVSINKNATLTVSWSASVHPLVAGTFTDTITLTVRAI